MAIKKFMSLERLQEYDELIKAEIAEGDASTLSAAKSYTDTSVLNITNGTTVVAEAEHATTADSATTATSATSATTAEKLGSETVGSTTKPIYLNNGVATAGSTYAGGTKVTLNNSGKGGSTASFFAPTSAGTSGYILTSSGTGAPTWEELDTYSTSEIDTQLAGKSDTTHNHDSAYDTKGAAATALSDAKTYADEKVANLLDNSTEAVDSIMELAEAMENNADAIAALETIAASKVPTSRKINGKALTADITLSASDIGADANGSASAVQTKLDTHTSNATVHITSTERTNWQTAYTHSQSAHAPSDAQVNVIESIKVNGIAQTISSKAVNITVPANAADIGAAPSTHGHSIGDITNLQTTLNNASSAINANTSSISAHTDRIVALESKVGDGFEEITSQDIQNLFNS